VSNLIRAVRCQRCLNYSYPMMSFDSAHRLNMQGQVNSNGEIVVNAKPSDMTLKKFLITIAHIPLAYLFLN
jgi:hypothetical protein